MADDGEQAKRRRQFRLSPVWIVPLVALLTGAWLVYDRITSQGPVVYLEMPNAEGIEAGKTLIQTRNVEVGRVEDVQLSEDLTHTVVRARLRAGTERMLNNETRFWVVKPRIGREGISGLNTVLSGAYIQLLPGDGEGERRRFEVLDEPPVAPADAEGLRLKVVGTLSNALATGDPVTYFGLTVGRVESVGFDTAKRQVNHQVYIRSPYDELITDTTRFWTASGVNVSVTSDGFSVDFESLETLLGGGLTFGVPENLPAGRPVANGARFELHADLAAARAGSFDRHIEYVLLVENSIRGLSAGAPVEYRGVRVGSVVSAPWRLRAPRAGALETLAVPVLVRIEPRRLEGAGERLALDVWRERFRDLVTAGLTASLRTGNLLTGAVYVDLNVEEDEGPATVSRYEGRPVMPVAASGVNRIEQQVGELLETLNELEFVPLMERLDGTLARSSATLDELRVAAARLNTLLADPATTELPKALQESLSQLRDTLGAYDGDSETSRRLNRALQRLETVLGDLQPMVRTLREQPNALIFDRREGADPQPRAPRQ